MSRATEIAQLADEAAPAIVIVFNGAHLRKLGTLPAAEVTTGDAIRPVVDSLLLRGGYTCTYVSISEALGRRCVIAHG